jgi:Ser/Thr protein kinase RdoA (MazF antagonist)
MSRGRDPFEAVLKTLASDPVTEFGAAGARVEPLGVVDGPFSTVRRVIVRSPGRTTRAYLKILKPRGPGQDELASVSRMLTREYQATLALYETLRQDDEIGAVRPIACLPEHRALVTEEVPGRPLSHFLRQADTLTNELESVAARVGRWVRTYQMIGGRSERVALDERRSYLDHRLQLLVGRVLSAAERQASLARFDELACAIGPSVPGTRIHADFSPTNIIVGPEGRVTVLDFTMAKTGTRHHDLSHAYFHLDLMSARHQQRAPIFRALQRSMLEGFDPALDARDALFRMMLMQHAVCHVALLAERRVPIVDVAYRWFLKRRWRTCEQIADSRERQPGLRVA